MTGEAADINLPHVPATPVKEPPPVTAAMTATSEEAPPTATFRAKPTAADGPVATKATSRRPPRWRWPRLRRRRPAAT